MIAKVVKTHHKFQWYSCACSNLYIPLAMCLSHSLAKQISATWMWSPPLAPVWPSPSGTPHAAVRAGPAVASATAAAWELAWLCSPPRPHYTAAGFDVVCEALPALLQPVALPPGHCSSCQQVSLLSLISPPSTHQPECTHIRSTQTLEVEALVYTHTTLFFLLGEDRYIKVYKQQHLCMPLCVCA